MCLPGGPGLRGASLERLLDMSLHRAPMLVDPPPGGLAIDGHARAVEALREREGLESIDLLGHSYGSLVALAYAAAHPDRVERLVLVATAARIRADQESATEEQLGARAGEPWFAGALEAARRQSAGDYGSDAELGALFARQLPLYFARYGDREAAFAARMAELPMSADALGHFERHERATFDLRPLLGRVAAPALVVVGERDPVLGPVSAREVADALPDARLDVIPDAGHFPWVEQPEAFERLVAAFLRLPQQ